MARRAGAKKTARKTAPKAAPKRARATGGDAAASLRRALLDLVETQGWIDLSFAEIAEQAGVPIAEAHRIYPSKTAVLLGLTRAIDERILNSLADDPLEGSAKDRLFDIVMRRFDVLKSDRSAYRRLMRQLPVTPNAFAALLCQLRRSLALTLEAAGISASGLKGALRLKGLLAIYVAGLRVFANDESEDLAKTMAEIDKRLGQAERLSEMLQRRRPEAA
ncbi:TetR family transcriptional regulator [Dongia sedimenti]|uniref:TetR family transcriptional regulator n=1 Tax=Dongia sedimenti TaxID=3064282 RepID=A0ABU0YQY7_9PROT|nr:TetR family transcriptional regulator [Rhodospirillaceae bacterium R-7]